MEIVLAVFCTGMDQPVPNDASLNIEQIHNRKKFSTIPTTTKVL